MEMAVSMAYVMCVMPMVLSLPDRTSNGILYPRQRFIPSEHRHYLGVHQSRNRLRCIHLCQQSSLCQTVMYDRRVQQCTLFSEHVEHGLGRLYDEKNENLITIRLDKDSREMARKEEERSTVTVSASNGKTHEADVCENCEL